VITQTRRPGWIEDEPGEIALPASPPGVIGGAVLRASRRSAGLSEQNLARMLRISPSVLRAWEDGVAALFCVRYDRLCQLADALSRAGAQAGQDVREFLVASQCDLLIAGILHGFEDFSEVPPIEEDSEGAAARGLLRWALTGAVPHRYRAHAPAGLLLFGPDVILFTAAARDLQAGSHGSHLVSFGTALVALAGP
jgi:transcriptional regulator with XRE-family HTH domain